VNPLINPEYNKNTIQPALSNQYEFFKNYSILNKNNSQVSNVNLINSTNY
jgi:hypothetical protein